MGVIFYSWILCTFDVKERPLPSSSFYATVMVMAGRQAKTRRGEYNRIRSCFLKLCYSEHSINLAINGFNVMFAEISHILSKIKKYSLVITCDVRRSSRK